jgi:hypothetical protein
VGAEPLWYDAREHGLAGDGVTNDQPALAALVDRAGAACAADGLRRVIHCPPGAYAIHDATTVWRSGVSLIGAGPGPTRFVLANPGDRAEPVALTRFTTLADDAGRENHLADVTFAGFEIDGSDVVLEHYDVLAKGLGLQYVLRGHFRDLYVHDTGATGFGCDFLQDTVVEGVLTAGCGRLDPGEEMGGAGIGIGIGGWGIAERTTISACTAVGNGTNGIFVELQRDYWPPPRGIRILGCHVEDNRYGISDWGADGLLVSGCTMLGNHVAGYDVSAQGTSGIGGRGGLVTGCVVDWNVRDGFAIGNTPGPYTIRGNQISNNGHHGYRQHNLARGEQEPARGVVLESNEIWGNALDGVHVDGAVAGAAIVGNRMRDNGRQSAPAAAGGGDTVGYTATTVVDTAARWTPDAHRGKVLRVGERTAVVSANTETELVLAPWRPGARTAWPGPAPGAGEPYALPAAPPVRAGATLAAAVDASTVRGNRAWDDQDRRTQTHGLWITPAGSCTEGRVQDNDLLGNAVAGARLDTAPAGGWWERNLGI